MKSMRQKLMLAGALGIGSVGLFGAAALGAFGPDASASVVSAVAPAASAVMGEDRTGDKLKQLLDGLAAEINRFVDRTWPIKPAVAPRAVAPNVKSFLGDMLQTARDYLGGVTLQDVTTAMRSGKSLGDIATEKGKTRDGLVLALTT